MSARTFSFEHRNLSEDSFPRREEAFVISADPVETENRDGSTSISMGFPIIAVSAWVADAGAFAAMVAKLLTEHYAQNNGDD